MPVLIKPNMRIGILSDIHGNKYALEKVLIQAKKENVISLIILGDITGYYYHTKEVIELLNAWPSLSFIRGNHEDFLIDVYDGKIDSGLILNKYGSSIDIALETITKHEIDFIKNLKERSVIELDSLLIEVAHGSPWNNNEYIYPDSNVETFHKFDNYNSDFIFLGHTHYPYIHYGTKTLVANPGSVGQSRVHGGIADWAIFDTEKRIYIPKQTQYDTAVLKKEVTSQDPHLPYLYKILER